MVPDLAEPDDYDSRLSRLYRQRIHDLLDKIGLADHEPMGKQFHRWLERSSPKKPQTVYLKPKASPPLDGQAVEDQLDIELLKESTLFGSLNQQERTYLASRMQRRLFKRGELLVAEGEPLEHIYLIGSGLVNVYQLNEQTQVTSVAQLGMGALVGELSLLTNNPPNASVMAMLDTEVWALSHFEFQHLLSRSISLALSLNRSLSAKLTASNWYLSARPAAQLTAIIHHQRCPSTEHLSLNLAEAIAYYTKENVLLIDGHPTNQSTLNRQAHWGESVEQLLQNTSLLLSHSHPAKGQEAEVRLICYSADEQTKADPGSLLWLVTHLRHFYKHIIVDLPHEPQALLTDTLSFMDRVVVTSDGQHLNDLKNLLTRLEGTHSVSAGLLAVTGWAGHFRMGEWWQLEKSTGWKVGALIDEQNRQDGIERLARRVASLRVGIAWGGGTARGWALAGIANALQQLKVPMDMFAGTSAGALGAAVYGLSLNYEIADQQMRSILPFLERTTRFFPPLTLSRHSLFAERWWNDLIQTFVGELTFDDMQLPYAAVALDLETGQQKVFKRGLLWKAIRASSSVPILAPPMMVDGRSYSDGGVINAIPLDVVKDMGADILIGIDLTGREKTEEWNGSIKPPMLPTLIRTINVAYNTAASRTMPLADVMIRPALRAAAVYDVSVMDEFMAEGERATREALVELRQVMPWLQ